MAAAIGHAYAATHPVKAKVVQRNLLLLGEPHPPGTPQVYAEFARVLADYFYAGSRPSAAP